MNYNKYIKYKKKYIDLKNNKKYSGAGIVLIENTIIPSIILFRNIASNKYENCGGKIDNFSNINPIANTAIRELFEESRCLIKLKHIDDYKYFNIKHRDKYYRSYIIGIEQDIISKKDYYNNKNIIDNDNTFSKYYKETNNIIKINIENIKNINKYNLSDRCKAILTELFSDNNNYHIVYALENKKLLVRKKKNKLITFYSN